MGKTRKLWNRLRGSHDGKSKAADDATGDSGCGSAQSPIGRVTTPEPDLATAPEGKDSAKEIWLDAYKKLEEDEGTKKMVLAYETLLSDQINGSTMQLVGGGNSCFSSGRTPEEKISGMRRVIEVTLEKASRHNERKQGFVKVAKIMNTISSSVIKPMIQIEAVASLALAGICVALEFSIRAATADIDMVDGLCHVAKRMEWYMLLHTLLLERAQSTTSVHDNQHSKLRDHLRKSIQELYTSLLLYEIQCVCYCYRDSHITRTLRALVTLDDWKGKLNDIKELESRVQMDMSQFEQSQTKDRLMKTAEDADEKFDGIHRMLQRLLSSHEQSFSMEEAIRLQKLVGLFNTSDYNRQMKFNPIRVPGTCEWFCNHGAFKKWLGSDGGLLLVSAAPGCGKSTLARHLIEEVLPREDFERKVLYFFFKDTNEQKHLNTAISAVLHQLLLDNHALVGELKEAIIQSGDKITENSSNLCNIFSAACREFSDGIICVFDALDECDPDDSPELIRRIKGMLGNDTKVKFLITTRGYPQLLNQFMEYESGLIHLDGDGKREKDAIQREISLVLEYRLEHLSKTKNLDHQPERKAAIEQALRSKGSEQRTYLWLKLVFDIMERIPWKSDHDWKKLIISPPRNVNDAYATLLQNVPEEEKAYVKIVLHLMVAAYRPLTLREMSIAIIVRDSPGTENEQSLGLQSDTEFKNWIIHTCGFFVTVYDKELYFIHQTAKEFLMSSNPGPLQPQGHDWFCPIADQAAHRIMAETSIAYLSLKCFNSRQFKKRAQEYRAVNTNSTARVSLYRDYELLDYTTCFWARHFRLCQSFDGTNFEDVGAAFIPHYLALFITDAVSPPGWILSTLQHRSEDVPDIKVDLIKRYNILDAALWFDHGRLLVYSLHHNTCIHDSLLHTAAGLDAANCVQFVAATGVDINAQDESGATALCAATSHGATKAANMLLDYNADVNLGTGPDKFPLTYIIQQYARASGYPELMRRVVRCGADVNNTRVKYFGRDGTTTPLAWATEIPMYTQMPLDNADNIERLDNWIEENVSASGFDNTADLLQHLDLSTAEEFLDAYNHSLVKLLLDHGADIDGVIVGAGPEGREFPGPRTALEHACFRVSVDWTSHVFWNAAFLLHSGADSSLNTETGNSALDWLLRAWIDEDFVRPGGLSNGEFVWDALAVLLLKHSSASAYVNKPITSKAMQTRLHWVTDFGSHRREKLKLLLDHGAEVNCQDSYGKTPIHYLVANTADYDPLELRDVLEMLIARGADPGARDSLGRTPMHQTFSAHVFRLLLKHGADLGASDSQGNTPLQSLLASSSQPDPEALKYLIIEMGASQEVINYSGETLIHTAANTGLITGFEYVFNGDVNLESVDKEGKTPLQAALDHRSHAVAALLLKRGVDHGPLLRSNFDIEQRDRRTGATLLAFVSKIHAYDAVEILLQRGANPNSLANDCLDDATITYADRVRHETNEDQEQEHSESFVANLWERADSHCEDETPLHLAARNGWTPSAEATINLLLKHGANIESKSRQHKTPFQVSCDCGNKEGLLFLLKMGADVNSTTAQGESALSTACKAWPVDLELIQDLLAHGATMAAGYHDGFDLLCRIAGSWSNSPDHTSGIPDGHRDISFQDPSNLKGSTRCYCQQCCREHERKACASAQILLDSGALIGVCDPQEDKSSLSRIARKRGWLELAKLLEQEDMPNRWPVCPSA